jgi:hypothetical protein
MLNEQVLLVNQASDPIDILWKNLGGTSRGIFLFRRLILHTLTIVVILFISTPAAMLGALKQIDIFGWYDNWEENLPNMGGIG